MGVTRWRLCVWRARSAAVGDRGSLRAQLLQSAPPGDVAPCAPAAGRHARPILTCAPRLHAAVWSYFKVQAHAERYFTRCTKPTSRNEIRPVFDQFRLLLTVVLYLPCRVICVRAGVVDAGTEKKTTRGSQLRCPPTVFDVREAVRFVSAAGLRHLTNTSVEAAIKNKRGYHRTNAPFGRSPPRISPGCALSLVCENPIADLFRHI